MCELMNDFNSMWNGARILKFNSETGIHILAGDTSEGNYNYEQGMPSFAKFNHPSGITIDKHDNLYVVEQVMNRLVKITPSGRVSTIAGLLYSGNQDGNFTTARFNTPIDIKIDSYGIINVLDRNSGNIRNINIGLQDKLIQERIPDSLITLRPLSGNTLYETIPNFPDLSSISSWKMSINFNWNGSGGWNAIIGNMYNTTHTR